jgi:uncharacterized protein YcfJ
MTNKTFAKAAAFTAATAMVAMTAAVPAAQAQSRPGGALSPVIGCQAPGGKQEGGAVIGALIGAALGSNLAKNDRGTGTAVGAVVGAGVGSTVGCKMQEQKQAELNAGYRQQGFGQVYSSGGQKLAQYVQPARYEKLREATFVARSTVNVRAGASTRTTKVDQIKAGQSFQALARTTDGQWILVGQKGVGVGYVSAAYVNPVGYRYAAY